MSDYPRNGRGGGGNGGPDRHARHRPRGGGGGGPYQRDGPPAWRGGGGGGGGGGFRGGRDDDGRVQYRGPGGGGGGGGQQHMYRGPPTASGPFVPQPQVAAAAAAAPAPPKIDRTKICPLLLRVYIQNDAHHSASSFAVRGEEPNEDSILIYTWPDASLRELAGLIQQVNPESRSVHRELSFAFVYPDKTGTNVIKHVMTIGTRAPQENEAGGGARGRGGAAAQQALARLLAADAKQLQQLGFETGDSLSVALLKK